MRGQPLTIGEQTDSTLKLATTGSVNSSCIAGNVFVVNFPKKSPGATPPGKIVLATARVTDANMALDVLAVGPPATMWLGTSEPAPILKAFAPGGGWVGVRTQYSITGYQFHPSMTIRLAKGPDTLSALQSSVPNSNSATAEFEYVDGQQGWWNLILTNPGGGWTGHENTLKVIKEVAAGDGFAGAAGGTVYLHVRPGKLPLTGPRAVAPSELTAADPGLRSELVASGAQRLRCLWPETRPQPLTARQRDGSELELTDFSKIYVLEFDDTLLAQGAVERLKRLDSVTDAHYFAYRSPMQGFADPEFFCEPRYLPVCSPEWVPNDSNFPEGYETFRRQWYLDHGEFFEGYCDEDVQSTCAWNNPWARGGSPVIVGLIDSGIDKDHPDLQHTYQSLPLGQKILPGINFAPHHALDFPPDPTDLKDDWGHGTNMAGLIAAISNNGDSYFNPDTDSWEGIAGVAGGWASDGPDSVGCRILPVRVLDYGNWLQDLSWLISGIIYAADNGARVINLALGEYLSGLQPDDLPHELRDALYHAMLLGSTCVAPVGNKLVDDAAYPAVFARWGLCVAVGATDPYGERAVVGAQDGSTEADFVDVAAPGQYIFTTQPTHSAGNHAEDWYVEPSIYYSMRFFGTSYSCALTSGVAASLLSVAPNLTDVDIKNVLRKTAVNYNWWDPVPNPRIGYGRADHYAAVEFVDPMLGRIAIGNTLTVPDSVQYKGSLIYGLTIRGVFEELGLPDGLYPADRYWVWFSDEFATPLAETAPAAWVNVAGTKGWPDDTVGSPPPPEHLFNYGGGFVWEATSTTIDLLTTVYWLPTEQVWVPCPPDEARVRYTAVGTAMGTTDARLDPSRVGRLSLTARRNPVRAGEGVQLEAQGKPGSGIVIEIYDVRGRRYREFRAEFPSDGRIRIDWNGRDSAGRAAPPGIYLIRARSGREAVTEKTVVVR
jgi:hypothetical protein